MSLSASRCWSHSCSGRSSFGRELSGPGRESAGGARRRTSRRSHHRRRLRLGRLAAAAAGILLGAFNTTATTSIGGSYTYDAIAATLVGGNAIQGGRGSVWRTLFGALLIADITDLLLLRGYSTGVRVPCRGYRRDRGRHPDAARARAVALKTRKLRLGAPAATQREVLPLVILAIAALCLALVPSISTATISYLNVYDVFQTFADYGLLALGVGFSMIVGEYDLSTASMYGLAGMVAVLTGESSPVLGILAALAVGVGAGVLQGAIISRLRMSSVPVTLGGFIIILGITYVISGDDDVSYNNISFGLGLDNRIAWVFSLRSLITLAVFAIVGVALRLTRFGTDVRATGGDRRASQISGVRVGQILVAVFALSGAGAAAAGSLHSYSLASAIPDLGFDPLIFATIAALLGGVRLSGGRGSPLGIAAGVLSLAILQEILGAIAAPEYTGDLVTGGLLIVVTIVAAPAISSWWERQRSAISSAATPNDTPSS